jgi:ankyrin repeat protein
LIGRGADINQPLPGDNIVPVIAAVNRKQLEVLNVLLESGARLDSPDSKGWTSLMWAGRDGFSEGVRVLLEKGADVNAKARDGATALMLASYRGHARTVAMLVRAGADTRVRDQRGLTARDVAEQQSRSAVLGVFNAAAKGSSVTIEAELFSFAK